jgi:hypothetical protein
MKSRKFAVVGLFISIFLEHIFCLPYDTLPITQEKLKDATSDPINRNCYCDKVTNICDPYCCCDSACAIVCIKEFYFNF